MELRDAKGQASQQQVIAVKTMGHILERGPVPPPEIRDMRPALADWVKTHPVDG